MSKLLELYNIHIGGSIADFHNLIVMWGISPIQITHPDPVYDAINKLQHKKDILRLKNWILDNSKKWNNEKSGN